MARPQIIVRALLVAAGIVVVAWIAVFADAWMGLADCRGMLCGVGDAAQMFFSTMILLPLALALASTALVVWWRQLPGNVRIRETRAAQRLHRQRAR